MRRWCFSTLLLMTAASLIVLCTAAYIADWLVLRLRDRSGSAYGSVMVYSTDVVREKAGRLEYYSNPPEPTPCVHALFPHQGVPPCWWLRRHSQQQRVLN